MGDVLIKVMGDTNESVQVISGQRRLEAALSTGVKVTAIDLATHHRYELSVIDGQLRAVEIKVH